MDLLGVDDHEVYRDDCEHCLLRQIAKIRAMLERKRSVQ